MTQHRIFIDSFVVGCYRVRSPGGHTCFFEDSDQFGPSKVNMRTGDVEPIGDRLTWFWRFYDQWRKADRPILDGTMRTPCGPLHDCGVFYG